MVIDKIAVIYWLDYDAWNLLHSKRYKDSYFIKDFISKYENDYDEFEEKELELSKMTKIGSWKYYCKFKLKDCESAFAFFYGKMNTAHEIDHRFCKIEFNPNKTPFPNAVLDFLNIRNARVARIMSIDVAFDLHNVPVSDIMFSAHGLSGTMSIGTLGSVNTRYLRHKAKDGRIKVYDKEKERESFFDAEKYKGVTRVEITHQDVGFLLQREFSNKSIDRCQQMLDDLNAVRVFNQWQEVNINELGLKPWVCQLIDSYIQLNGVERISEILCQMCNNQRSRYKKYVDKRIGASSKAIYDGDSISYCLDLSGMIEDILPFHQLADDESLWAYDY